MKKITENDIENLAIELLKEQGYQYFLSIDPALDNPHVLRISPEEFLLSDVLKKAMCRLNPDVPAEAIEDAFNQVKSISSSLIDENEIFHKCLIEGVKVSVRKGSETRGDFVRLIDFENPENNEFYVINQFTVIENNCNHRPDIVLFVNGLPLVVMELKNPRKDNMLLSQVRLLNGLERKLIIILK